MITAPCHIEGNFVCGPHIAHGYMLTLKLPRSNCQFSLPATAYFP